MLDTVTLNVAEMDYRVTKPDFFIPNASYISSHKFYGTRFANKLKSKDTYYPKVTITPRSKGKGFGAKNDLRIEFSATKLIFGNNLEELSIYHENDVYKLLKERLSEMGIEILVSPAIFQVSRFDTSKNIFLSKGYFSFQIISELRKCGVCKPIDLSCKDYQEGGNTLHFYNNDASFVIYDKLAELIQSKAKLSKNIVSEYVSRNQEILRFEVRLKTKAKMKEVLSKIGYKVDNLTFANLFDETLWTKILDYYWNSLVVNKNRFIFNMTNSLDSLLNKLQLSNPKIKPKEATQLIGTYYMAKEKGLQETRKIFEKRFKLKNWSRFSKDFEILNQITEIEGCFGWFGEIDRVLRFDNE